MNGDVPGSLDEARQLDRDDPLGRFRERFHIPTRSGGSEEIYFSGHSLGLQPRSTADYIDEELEAWRTMAVRGHFEARHPWMPYHRFLTAPMAEVVGAEESEVVVMNSLTTNLHLLMVSFYRPERDRHRVLIESKAFPSDHFAVESQIGVHGYDPGEALIALKPREGETLLRVDDIVTTIEREGDSIALVLLPGVQYYTGQAFPIREITRAAHARGCVVGFDLAHAAGNLRLALHDDGPDFAVWCSYKYLNSGPGSVGAAFVHERHLGRDDLPRFAGWWGHDEKTRFRMETEFRPMPTVEAWQLSNPPILSLAAIRASLDLFREAGGMEPLRQRSLRLTGALEALLRERAGDAIEILTPSDPAQRGCQLSLRIASSSRAPREVFTRLEESGIVCDWREPDVIRAAPVPLYNRFEDVWTMVDTLVGLL